MSRQNIRHLSFFPSVFLLWKDEKTGKFNLWPKISILLYGIYFWEMYQWNIVWTIKTNKNEINILNYSLKTSYIYKVNHLLMIFLYKFITSNFIRERHYKSFFWQNANALIMIYCTLICMTDMMNVRSECVILYYIIYKWLDLNLNLHIHF